MNKIYIVLNQIRKRGKSKINKYICFFLLSFLFWVVSYAQPEEELYAQKKLPSFIPASPNASSITKLANISANNYNGLVNLSIPLYNISLKQLKLPINLSYNSSGVKVEEYSTSYGMSWNLTAGGVITRTVKGKPDDGPNGYMSGIGTLVDLYVRDQMNPQDKLSFERDAAESGLDTEPDIYNYNFPGQSGKFCTAPSGRILTIPYEPLKITKDEAGFTIVDTYGNKYEFKQKETVFSYSSVFNGETNNNTTPIEPETTTNAWYLTKITTACNEEIIYSYSTSNIKPTYNGSYAAYYLAEPDFLGPCTKETYPHAVQYDVKTTTYQETKQQKIRSIKFPGGEIDFNYQLKRTDLLGDSALTNIKIKNDNISIKEYNLTYNYFASRLYLSQVQESGQSENILPYTIEYNNPAELPERTSFSQDYWGYYNGASNSSLIPKIHINLFF